MATVVVQKRKGKRGMSYAVKYAHPLTGTKKHYATFKKHKEAHQAANELRALLDLGNIPEQKRKLDPLTFLEVGLSLRKAWESQLKSKRLSQKTYEDYCYWLNVLTRVFEKRLLCHITKAEIEAYRDNKASESSNVTANKHFLVIRKVFQQGLSLGAVTSDQTEKILLLSEKEHVRNKFLLPQSLDTLIEKTKEVRAKFYLPAIIYLGAEHGGSKQEILSLEWPHINFEYEGRGFIRFFRTKNRKERTEFLMPRTREALISWKNHLEWMRHRRKIIAVKSDYVFCRLDGTPIKSFNRAWWSVLKKADIKDFHFHDLRHTFCSNLIMSGAGLKEAKEMIGHSDIAMTDRYSHLCLTHKLASQERLAIHYLNGNLR